MLAFSTIFNSIVILVHIADITRSSTNVISCALNTCRNTTINCIDDHDCFISCSTANGCHQSIINCPPSQECIVLCEDIGSCKGSTINGTSSSLLHITGCIHDQSCLDLNIYCPQDIHEDENCFVEGNDNLGSVITIHAAYGWNQMKIEYEGTFSNNLSGKLYCDTNYDISCDIAPDEWTCIEPDAYCNDISFMRTTDDTQAVTDAAPWVDIDTEMTIIVATMIAAFCFITLCCWLNRYKHEEKAIDTEEVKMTSTITVDKKGEEHDQYPASVPRSPHSPNTPQSAHLNTTLSKQRTRSEPMRVKQAHDTETMSIKQQRYRKSTGASRPKQRSARKKKKHSNPAKYVPPIATDLPPAQKNVIIQKKKEEVVQMEEAENVNRNAQNAQTARRNGARRKLKENDLEVITESAPVETKKMPVLNVKVNKRLQFRADASDSDTMGMKVGDLNSPDTCHTWDDFDQQNGILADRVKVDQMMGFLEEGAIACSYE